MHVFDAPVISVVLTIRIRAVIFAHAGSGLAHAALPSHALLAGAPVEASVDGQYHAMASEAGELILAVASVVSAFHAAEGPGTGVPTLAELVDVIAAPGAHKRWFTFTAALPEALLVRRWCPWSRDVHVVSCEGCCLIGDVGLGDKLCRLVASNGLFADIEE